MRRQATSPADRILVLAAVLLGCVFLLSAVRYGGGRWLAPLDDTYIALAYGRNLAHGLPFRFNPGDPPSTGATSPAWTALVAPLTVFGDGGASLLVPLVVLCAAVFALALVGWLLGWLVIRFWSDWGAVALLVWMALEIETALEELTAPASRRRVALAVASGVAVLLVLSASARGGRAAPPERSFLSLTAKAADPYLPEPGGILYTDDMRLFFQVFYGRPTAPWRYVVGYEPALMPPDDLATFRRVLAARTPASFAPWIRKMTPTDRLILQSTEGRPQIPELEWAQVSQTLSSGRVSRPPAPSGARMPLLVLLRLGVRSLKLHEV